MHPFALSRADNPAQAIAAHARDARLAFIAGGTDLIGLIEDCAALAERLLDINGLPGMAGIEPLPGGGLRIGAHERRGGGRAGAPALSGHRRSAADGGFRGAAQHGVDGRQHHAAHALRLFPRRRRAPVQQAATGLRMLHGLNRNHAIFGWSEACAATHPSDLAVALAALDAIVIVRGQAGERSIISSPARPRARA